MLLKQIAAETKDPVSLFSSFFTNFKSNLIKLNNEIKLREDVEGEQKLSEEDEKDLEYTAKELTGKVANTIFITETIDVLSIFVENIQKDALNEQEKELLQNSVSFFVS